MRIVFEVEGKGIGVIGVHMADNALLWGAAIAESGGGGHFVSVVRLGVREV